MILWSIAEGHHILNIKINKIYINQGLQNHVYVTPKTKLSKKKKLIIIVFMRMTSLNEIHRDVQ